MKRTPSRHDIEPADLGDLLGRLPAHAPRADTWSRIRERAAARQRRRQRMRAALPLAMAASVLVALGIAHTLHTRPAASLARHAGNAPAATAAANAASLAQLQRHSMRLEQWLAELRAHGAPLQGTALASAVSLQDRIGLIDLQLGAPGTAGDRRGLWRQRIRLLQNLAMLRASQSPLADQRVTADNRSAYTL